MRDVWQDLRYAARLLARNPTFVATAVLTLGLGIGANTAIFSVVNAVLLRPLPYANPERLVRIAQHNPYSESGHERTAALNQEHFLQWRARTRTLSFLAAFERQSLTLTAPTGSARLPGARVSAALFPMLGATPEIGRAFAQADEQPGGPSVVVLSHTMWQRYFGLDPAIVGRTIRLDGRPHGIAGVMPASFEFPDQDTLFWTPFVFTPPARVRDGGEVVMVQAIGRLKSGVSGEQAAAEANTPGVIADLSGRIEVLGLKDQLFAPFRPALTILLVSVGVVLLIACVNVANLLLSRAASRQQEVIVRSALGASRTRLVRQIFTESLLLATLGGAAGVLIAYRGIPVLAALDPGTIPRLGETRLDTPVLVFSIAISLITGIAFGLAPALHLSRVAPPHRLRATRVRGLLTAAEVALAMVLLVTAGVLIKGFVKVSTVSRGFNPENALTFGIALPESRYPADRGRQVLEEFLSQLRAEPDVNAAALSDSLPSQAARITALTIGKSPDGRRIVEQTEDIRIVSGDFFKATGMTVVEGRTFDDGDRAGGPLVVLINRTMARQRFGDQDPLGRTVGGPLEGMGPARVIGVVEDVRPAGVDARIRAEIYVDFRQAGPHLAGLPILFTVRTVADPAPILARERTRLRQIDAQLLVENVATMGQRLSDSVAQPRFYAVTLGAFAFIALTLATVGLYGVMSYAVSQRTREIGVRMALGARRADVLRLIVGEGLAIALAGVAAGLAGAFAVTRYLGSMLFGVPPFDLAIVGAVTLLFGAVIAVATCIPAEQATRVDPVVALRYE